jgi:glutaminase
MQRPVPDDTLDHLLADIAEHVRPAFGKGQVADYIPELARVNPRKFAIAVAGVNGAEAAAGDADEPFSLQSITKLFALEIALNAGGDDIWTRVGKEPSGTPFNHLAILEAEQGAPRNPFVNAGALAVTDYLMGKSGDAGRLVLEFIRASGGLSGGTIDQAVANSEIATAHKNRAIAHILKVHGRIDHDPDHVVDSYCRQCAIAITVRELARAALPLATEGYSRHADETILSPRVARRVNAVMMTCGMYDSTGSFAYRVGLPAKSGVGGGIVAVSPGRGAVAVWSPELDRAGNSLVGTIALELFVQHTGWAIL